MRVNVSKAFISKTFMYGLKVSLQPQLTESNKKSLEFYLNLNYKIVKPTLVIAVIKLLLVALKILTEFATFATLLLLQLTLLLEFINIFISFNVFSRSTVLMNDLRLKTFYCKLIKSSKFIKNSTTSSRITKSSKPTSKLSTLRPAVSASSSAGRGEAAAAAAVAFVTSAAVLFKQTGSKNNNHHRTYNNSGKSNKVFLCYTPRDPRLRIFFKTKHFFNRPQQQNQLYERKNTRIICYTGGNKSSLKVLSDLCNYGELIGGGGHRSGECNSGDNKTICKQLNISNLSPTQIICDNLIILSDNLIVATAGAAIETISANIFIIIAIAVVISEHTKELLKSIEILLSNNFQYNQQQSKKVSYVKSTFRLCVIL